MRIIPYRSWAIVFTAIVFACVPARAQPTASCDRVVQEKPQVPSIHAALAGRTTERADGRQVHYKALFDDRGRMMAIICHNTDLGDSWERIGVDESYLREYSEKKAYPMGINILFFALTQAR